MTFILATFMVTKTELLHVNLECAPIRDPAQALLSEELTLCLEKGFWRTSGAPQRLIEALHSFRGESVGNRP